MKRFLLFLGLVLVSNQGLEARRGRFSFGFGPTAYWGGGWGPGYGYGWGGPGYYGPYYGPAYYPGWGYPYYKPSKGEVIANTMGGLFGTIAAAAAD